MPRIRTIKPEALQHRKVGRLSDRAFRLWIGLVTQADDGGRLPFDAAQCRLLFWGYHIDVHPKHVAEALDEIRSFNLCRLYREGDSLYVDLPSWRDHQSINKAVESKLPGYTHDRAYSGSTPVGLPEDYRSTTVGSEGSEGRKEGSSSTEDSRSALTRTGQPASAPQGAPAGPAQDKNSDQNHPGPLADPIAEFMATVRRAAANPVPGLIPRRRDDAEL